MTERMKVYRTERIWLKPTKKLGHLCHISKNLYNEANYIIRQAFINENQWIRLSLLQQELSSSSNYQELPVSTAKKVLWLVDLAWKSYFRAITDWQMNPEKYLQKPQIPKYKQKNGEFQVVFKKFQLTFENQELILPLQTGVKIKTRLISTTDLVSVRIVPRGVGYTLEVIYSKYLPKVPNHSPFKIIGIDLGITNLITMTNNIGKESIVIKGGVMKSINQYYNKEKARLQSIYAKQNTKYGKQMKKLITRRDRKVDNYFHEVSRSIVKWCEKNSIDTVVIGQNKNWKVRMKLGKKVNQNFISIPFSRLIRMIQYKTQDAGIRFIVTREDYTSKCSFLDGESIGQRSFYAGERINRGLYRAKNGTLINSDVNGAYNIIKKAVPNAFSQRETADGIEGVWLHPVRWKAKGQPVAC